MHNEKKWGNKDMKKLLASTLALMAGLALCLPAHAARTNINATTPAAILSGAPSANALDVSFTAIDNANGNKTAHNGQLMLIFYNSDVSSGTFTITTVADSLGRTGDITTYSLGAGEYAIVGPIPTQGYAQTDGYLYYTGSAATMKVLPVQLSGSLNYR